MPLKSGMLTPKERVFTKAMAATGSVAEAGRRAGYRGANSPYMVAARPAIAAEVERLQIERMTNEALPLAIDTLLACMRSNTAPWNAKNMAAKITLEYTAGRHKPGDAQEPHEMSAAEIQAEIVRLEARKVELERPMIEGESIEVAPAGGAFD